MKWPYPVFRTRPFRVLLALAATVTLLWFGRHFVLTSAGRLLVAEDTVEPVEMIIASDANLLGNTLEAAHLYHDGVSTRIVLPVLASNSVAEEIRRLGGSGWSPTDSAAWLLDRSGVRESSIQILPGVVDGSDSEIVAVAAFARQQKPNSLLYITARTHTARARRLLRSQLPPGTRLLVRSPRTDDFAADSWWHSREQSRDVVMEYLRWVNSFVFGDLWAKQ
ncbi:MAG: hypothetical protein ABSA52_21510 [Candidatus Binatia bacterium]|jgi:uncharacterized SAM-binding protein YcdF (DUF218 family)